MVLEEPEFRTSVVLYVNRHSCLVLVSTRFATGGVLYYTLSDRPGRKGFSRCCKHFWGGDAEVGTPK